MFGVASLEQIKFWFDVVQTLMIFAFWLHTWLNNRHAVTNTAIAEIKRQIDLDLGNQQLKMSHLSEQIIRLEQDLKHAPSYEDFERVYERLEDLSQKLSTLTGEFKGINKTLGTIHDAMINKGI